MKLKSTVIVTMLLTTLGCSSSVSTDYSKLGLVEVAGVVTLDGNPIAGAAVFFNAPDETYCFGVTNSAGRYSMMLNSEKSGVTPGEKRVEITTSRNPLGDGALSEDDGEEEEFEGEEEERSNAEQIPACYNSESTLTVTITDSDSNLDFELKSDCSTNSAT